MKKMEKTWQAPGLCDLHHGAVHDCHQCCRSCKNKIDSQPSSHPQNSRAQGTPFTHPSPPSSPAWAVCADDRERTYERATSPLPAMSPQQLCTQSSQSPSEYGSGDESDENLDNIFPDSPVRIPRQRRRVRVLQD